MWFERPALEHLEQFQDNLMWETDYPHPVAQWPTPTSAAALPADEAVEYSFAGASDEIRDKILYRNAARLYHLD
jgi:predicted TIM-barrel fold metal-dependent hydrolase